MIRYMLAWAAMLFIAIANGALRQLTFGKTMTDLHAHQLSTLIGSVAIGLFIYAVIRIWPPSSGKKAIEIGLMWLILTVSFEFGFGRWIMHETWGHVLNAYNLAEGRVWIVFLGWITTAPFVFYRHMRKERRRDGGFSG